MREFKLVHYSCCEFCPPHCKDKIPKFRNKHSQKRNIGVSVPISTFMRLWAIYIFPRPVSLFCWRKYVDQSWDYINRSQAHECWNWGWGREIPRKGIHHGDFPYSARKMLPNTSSSSMMSDLFYAVELAEHEIDVDEDEHVAEDQLVRVLPPCSIINPCLSRKIRCM
jgi:hypothetical protein